MKALLKSLTASRTATAEALDGLDLIRESIAAKRQEIARIERSPLPVQDALKRFDAWADGLATQAVDALDVPRLADPSARDGGLRMPVSSAPETLLGLVLLVARDQVRKTLAGQLGDLLVGREALTDAERSRRIAVAEKELRQAMALEEIACRELEQAGVQIIRRADADPGIVLATDASLQRLAQ